LKSGIRNFRDAGENKMSFFDSAGVKIHYHDIGSGEPVVLVHGFASTAEHN
jgi:pimeloyl-ACP methyl ester carboxylesterase